MGEDPSGDPRIDEVKADIAATRAELEQTVDALGDKLNVKKQARHSVDEMRERAADAAAKAKQAAPEPVQHAMDRAAAATGPYARQAAAVAAPHRTKILAGVSAALVVLLVVRRRRRGSEA